MAAKNHGLSAKLGLRFPAKPECHGPRPPRSVSLAAVNRNGRTLQGGFDGQGVRRDRHGRALRRFANSDVAGAQGVPGAGRGPCFVPERHRLNPSGASARCQCAIAMGAARPAGGDRMPADPHLHLRLWRIHDCRRPGHGQGCCRLLPAADNPRQTAGRRRRRIRRGDPPGLCRRGKLSRERVSSASRADRSKAAP